MHEDNKVFGLESVLYKKLKETFDLHASTYHTPIHIKTRIKSTTETQRDTSHDAENCLVSFHACLACTSARHYYDTYNPENGPGTALGLRCFRHGSCCNDSAPSETQKHVMRFIVLRKVNARRLTFLMATMCGGTICLRIFHTEYMLQAIPQRFFAGIRF